MLIYHLDINECVVSTPCHTNANCTDTFGFFNCQCKSGYQGNGFICLGKCCVRIIIFWLMEISERAFLTHCT